MLHIRISEQAFKEIEESKDYYNLQKNELGSDFKGDVLDAVRNIATHPKLYPLINLKIRRCLLHRFSFSIFYSENETAVIILSVAHQHRKPKYH